MLNFPNPLSIMFPGAAGNWQAFDARFLSPNVSVNFAGNPAVEREVTEDVASYGSQLGWLNDIVVALADAATDTIKADKDAGESLKKLKDALKKIDKIKERRKTDAYDTARGALAQLGSSDKDAYGRLVRSLDPDRPPSAT
jgi:hypothetical protein